MEGGGPSALMDLPPHTKPLSDNVVDGRNRGDLLILCVNKPCDGILDSPVKDHHGLRLHDEFARKNEVG